MSTHSGSQGEQFVLCSRRHHGVERDMDRARVQGKKKRQIMS
jgi:hypothetical protein